MKALHSYSLSKKRHLFLQLFSFCCLTTCVVVWFLNSNNLSYLNPVGSLWPFRQLLSLSWRPALFSQQLALWLPVEELPNLENEDVAVSIKYVFFTATLISLNLEFPNGCVQHSVSDLYQIIIHYLSYTHHEEEHMNHISNTTEPSSASAKASPAADMLSAT